MDVHTPVPSCEHSEAKLPAWGLPSSKNASAFPSLSPPLFISTLDETAYASSVETLILLLPPILCALQSWELRSGWGITVPHHLWDWQSLEWPTPGCLGPHLEPWAHLGPHGIHTILARSHHSHAHLTAQPICLLCAPASLLHLGGKPQWRHFFYNPNHPII